MCGRRISFPDKYVSPIPAHGSATPLIFSSQVLALSQWTHQTADFLGLQPC